ncbi:MAG: hypothetical protein ACREO3_04790 [Arenimonas sp.]
MPRWAWLALVIALAGALAWHATRRTTVVGGDVVCTLPPPFVDASTPLQSDVAGMAPFRLGRAQVTPLAGISLEARVLSRRDYSSGNEAEFSPTDLALGWGPMAAADITDRLDITQSGRWYQYRWENSAPMPPAQIARNSANMHLVPADADVAALLAAVREGDTVQVEGWLVRIDRDDGWHWRSSLRRDDTGSGSCELVYVCALRSR